MQFRNLGLDGKVDNFSMQSSSPSIPRHVCHHNERNSGGGSRYLSFLVPPFEKGSIFRVKVTGWLLWGGVETL